MIFKEKIRKYSILVSLLACCLLSISAILTQVIFRAENTPGKITKRFQKEFLQKEYLIKENLKKIQ